MPSWARSMLVHVKSTHSVTAAAPEDTIALQHLGLKVALAECWFMRCMRARDASASITSTTPDCPHKHHTFQLSHHSWEHTFAEACGEST
jgi:hypothetical protein